MVSDQQVKRLWRLSEEKLSLEIAAVKAGMDPKTARKYLRNRRLPSKIQKNHTWRKRQMRFLTFGNKRKNYWSWNLDSRRRPCFSI